MNSTRLLSIAILLAVAILGYVFLQKMSRVEEQLGVVGLQVSEIGEDARTAAETAAEASRLSEDALSRAVSAEENARDAALGRQEAERTAARAAVTASMANREAREAQAELERIELERQAEIDRLEAALGGVVDTNRTAVGLIMNLGSDAIEFDFDQAVLRPAERELLSRIAGVLLTARGFSVFVYGHTDDVGNDAYNQMLSEHRASAVRDYLVEAGIDPGIVEARGYGKTSPRVSGGTADARRQNRRVEIGIVDVFLSDPELADGQDAGAR